MKKSSRKIKMVMIAAAVITAVAATPASAAKVKLSKKTLTMTVGQKKTLKLKGTKKKVKWSTSKKSVATVSKKGVVTAKKKGKAIITAKVGKKKYTCKVTVKAKKKKKTTKPTKQTETPETQKATEPQKAVETPETQKTIETPETTLPAETDVAFSAPETVTVNREATFEVTVPNGEKLQWETDDASLDFGNIEMGEQKGNKVPVTITGYVKGKFTAWFNLASDDDYTKKVTFNIENTKSYADIELPILPRTVVNTFFDGDTKKGQITRIRLQAYADDKTRKTTIYVLCDGRVTQEASTHANDYFDFKVGLLRGGEVYREAQHVRLEYGESPKVISNYCGDASDYNKFKDLPEGDYELFIEAD